MKRASLDADEYMRKNVFFVGLEPKTDKDGEVQRKPVLDEHGGSRQWDVTESP
ncbi:MAG: hypothetical protein V8Q91_08005 [Bilophila wadsworthia]|uniref:hypothetical protein n=1 Tax=Bilophila wadsworthia TaxID=35833 RepID=UPI00300F6C9D